MIENEFKLQFQVKCGDTKMGDDLYILGDNKIFGEWKITSEQTKLYGNNFPLWQSEVISFKEKYLKYKYIIKKKDNHIIWEDKRPDRELDLSNKKDGLYLIDDGIFNDKNSNQTIKKLDNEDENDENEKDKYEDEKDKSENEKNKNENEKNKYENEDKNKKNKNKKDKDIKDNKKNNNTKNKIKKKKSKNKVKLTKNYFINSSKKGLENKDGEKKEKQKKKKVQKKGDARVQGLKKEIFT